MTMIKLEYEAKIRDLERQLNELKQAKVDDENDLPAPPHPRWMPDCGKLYYYIKNDGITSCFSWNNTDWDFGRRHIGNVFVAEEAAKFAAEHLEVLAEMREWAGNWNDPYRIIYIDGRVEPETVFVGKCISYGEIRFATEADAKNCIKAVGEDRLKKYYFGIS